MEARGRNLEVIVRELKAVKGSFEESYDACPVCILDAIKILEVLMLVGGGIWNR